MLLKPIRGKVRVWQIRVVDKGDFAVIQTEYGQQGSKITVTEKEVKSGKNIGRSNETTPYQQALLEAKAAWTLVKKDGYVEDLTTFKPTMKPMSYHTFMDNLKKVTWPAITQPKLEGIHCVVRRCGNSIAYMSRELNLFSTLDYMTDHLLAILEDGEDGVVAGRGVAKVRIEGTSCDTGRPISRGHPLDNHGIGCAGMGCGIPYG